MLLQLREKGELLQVLMHSDPTFQINSLKISLPSEKKRRKMRAATHYLNNVKLIAIFFFFLFLLLLIFGSSFQSSSTHPINSDSLEEKQSTSCLTPPPSPACTKITPSLAHALVYYATSNITPQQTRKEISVSQRILEKKSPCNFLVFGLGHDSLMWTALNYGGRTIFLEEDKSWIEEIKKQLPSLESYHVVYDTKVTQADELLEIGIKEEECKVVSDPRFSKCQLALKELPNEVYDIEWDLIMVDAPTGWHDGAPGRMKAIYTAGLMARNRENVETDVFVHDVDRMVEDKFSKTFLCEGYLREEEGRIRHFTIPSHRVRQPRPFCPIHRD